MKSAVMSPFCRHIACRTPPLRGPRVSCKPPGTTRIVDTIACTTLAHKDAADALGSTTGCPCLSMGAVMKPIVSYGAQLRDFLVLRPAL